MSNTYLHLREEQEARLNAAMNAPVDLSPSLDDTAFQDAPPYEPGDAMGWPFILLLGVLLCVFLGMTAAFVIENMPLIVAMWRA